jgi:hypothetical protein
MFAEYGPEKAFGERLSGADSSRGAMKHIFAEGEFATESVIPNFRITAADGELKE